MNCTKLRGLAAIGGGTLLPDIQVSLKLYKLYDIYGKPDEGTFPEEFEHNRSSSSKKIGTKQTKYHFYVK